MLLSELFVDTELTANDLSSLATRLAVLPQSVAELDGILRNEVAPVAGHWMQYAGAIGPWPGFDPEELVSAIKAHLAASQQQQSGREFAKHVWSEWKGFRVAIELKRNLASA